MHGLGSSSESQPRPGSQSQGQLLPVRVPTREAATETRGGEGEQGTGWVQMRRRSHAWEPGLQHRGVLSLHPHGRFLSGGGSAAIQATGARHPAAGRRLGRGFLMDSIPISSNPDGVWGGPWQLWSWGLWCWGWRVLSRSEARHPLVASEALRLRSWSSYLREPCAHCLKASVRPARPPL